METKTRHSLYQHQSLLKLRLNVNNRVHSVYDLMNFLPKKKKKKKLCIHN